MRGGGVELAPLARTVALAALFVAACLLAGGRAFDRALARREAQADVAPGRILTFVTVLAVLGAALTKAIGIHAVHGGFVVGGMVGASARFRERTRQT